MAKNRNRDSDSEKKFTNVGALWRTRNGSKNVVASGALQMEGRDGETLDVLLMKNDKGDNQKRPDFRLVVVSDDDDDNEEDRRDRKSNKGGKSKNNDNDDPPF